MCHWFQPATDGLEARAQKCAPGQIPDWRRASPRRVAAEKRFIRSFLVRITNHEVREEGPSGLLRADGHESTA